MKPRDVLPIFAQGCMKEVMALLRPFIAMCIAAALLLGSTGSPALAQGEAVSAAERHEQQIRALMAGELDPAIPAASLFDYALGGADGQRLRAVARMVGDDDFFERASSDTSVLSPLKAQQARLALTEASFLRLPLAQRRKLLSDHAKSHKAYLSSQEQQTSQSGEVDRLTHQLAALRAFLDGKPANPDALKANALTASAILSGPVPKEIEEPAADAPVADRIAWLKNRILIAQNRILQLPAEEYARLSAAARLDSGAADQIAMAEAQLDEASLQLDSAQQAAIEAASERERLVASERARLLATKKAQAQFRSDLAQRAGEPARIADEALSWRRRVMSAVEDDRSQADELYVQLVEELTQVRRSLRKVLNQPDYPAFKNLDPPPLDAALPQDTDATRALRAEERALDREANGLRAAYLSQLWEERSALRDAMGLLNDARLTLLGSLSKGKRARVTGFGTEGVAQVQREISEIVLEVRFSLQSWRLTLAQLINRVAAPSPGFVLAMLRIFALLVFFAWWRRRGDALLTRWQRDVAEKRPRTVSRSAQMAGLRIWRRIRASLDWLALVALLWWFWPEELEIIDLHVVWIVLFWSLATFTLVGLVNELARGRGREDPRAALRWKSLKLLAGTLLTIGLMLNLTRASVGRGAIYNWVTTVAWLIVPVVALLLVHWWRARIVALARAEAGDSALLRWIGTDPGGISGGLGRVAVGLVLLLKGLQSILSRRMRDIALVREMLEQRARAAAVKQVAQDKASGRYRRLPPEVTAVFEPHRLPAKLRFDEHRPGYGPLPDVSAGSMTLVVGERGLGKSSFLRDLAAQVGSDCEVIEIEVPPCPPAGFLDELAVRAGVKGRKRKGQTLVIVDDIQRLIVPAIGGLAALDRLIGLARDSGPDHRWVFAIAESSWRFLQRARSDRILFDSLITLPHWSTAELRSLVERRTQQARIEPDFSAMADEGVFEFGEEVSPDERKTRGYFERLSEYVGGNPAIALDYWRRSLFVDGHSGIVTVRTFDTPPVDKLSALPINALFVLRVILQMDFAGKDAIQASTDLSDLQVTDALRRLERIGAIKAYENGYQIALHWWMEVVRLLARQNLIVREKP